jgi:predicted RNA binding protein YcfA (HicA-like mRNA interferase family)
MSRITPIHWKILECIFLQDGFVFDRQEGSHRVYVKDGVIRPIIIPTYKNVSIDIIMSNMRSAKMTRKRYFELLAKCSK